MAPAPIVLYDFDVDVIYFDLKYSAGFAFHSTLIVDADATRA